VQFVVLCIFHRFRDIAFCSANFTFEVARPIRPQYINVTDRRTTTTRSYKRAMRPKTIDATYVGRTCRGGNWHRLVHLPVGSTYGCRWYRCIWNGTTASAQPRWYTFNYNEIQHRLLIVYFCTHCLCPHYPYIASWVGTRPMSHPAVGNVRVCQCPQGRTSVRESVHAGSVRIVQTRPRGSNAEGGRIEAPTGCGVGGTPSIPLCGQYRCHHFLEVFWFRKCVFF